MSSQKSYVATIHGGTWEIIEYSPHLLTEIRRVNRENPGEIKLLGIFPTEAQAEEICARYVPLDQHLKRSREIIELLRRLIEARGD